MMLYTFKISFLKVGGFYYSYLHQSSRLLYSFSLLFGRSWYQSSQLNYLDLERLQLEEK